MKAATRVVLRPEVPDDLQGIVDYLDERAGVAVADRFIANVFIAFEEIRAMPGIGSPKTYARTGLTGVRSRSVPGFPNHLVYYQRHVDAMVVLAVIHGARNIRAVLKGRSR